MCPLCVATVTLIAAGASSTGGMTAIALFRRRGKKNENKMKNMESEHGQQQDNDDNAQAHSRNT